MKHNLSNKNTTFRSFMRRRVIGRRHDEEILRLPRIFQTLAMTFFFAFSILLLSPSSAHAATVCWDGGGADNNWNTAANWAGDVVPTTTDTALFDPANCPAALSNKNVQINVNPNVSGTGGGISIASSYTGGATQSAAIAITIGSAGYTQAGGTFTGASSGDITIQSGGDFLLSGGTFTSTGGTLTAQDDFTISSGTFSHNNGTLMLDSNADGAGTVTIGASLALYALSLGQGCQNSNITLSTNTILVVNNTLTFPARGCNSTSVNGPGTIEARGDLTTAIGVLGTVVITINGTGAQAITGSSTNGFPSVTINKTAGTLTFSGTVRFRNDFT